MSRDEPDRASREPPANEKRLVVVVQGIGDEEPGATVGALARGLAASTGRTRVPSGELLWLAEGSSRQVEDFPCHVERLHEEGTETVLAEVYWADLSRLGRGLLAPIGGLIRMVFGLRHLARHASGSTRSRNRRPDLAARTLQGLSRLAFYLLRGPLAAWCLLSLTMGALTVLFLTVAGETVDQRPWVTMTYVGVGFAAFAIGRSVAPQVRGGEFAPTAVWISIGGLIQAGLALALYWEKVPWLTGAFDRSFEDLLGRPFGVDFASFYAVFGTVLVLFWGVLGLAVLAAAFAWPVARFRAEPAYRPGLDAACLAVMAQFIIWWAAWLILRMTIYWQGRGEREFEEVRSIERLGSDSLGVLLMVAAAMGLSFLGALGAHRRWARSATAATYAGHRAAPRLIVSRWIRDPVIVFTALLLAEIFVVSVAPNRGFFESVDQWRQFRTRATVIAIPITAVVGMLLLQSGDRLRQAIDFALDVITYFTRRTGQGGQPAFFQRELIAARFRTVLRRLVRREEPGQLSVVAHSQGTIIAVDVLAERGAEAVLHPLRRCDLVTMGSPFHHIYQHYFPNDYPPLSDARWDGLRERVDRWLNIFRIDDYVGTDIDPGGEWPENCPVDSGGHTGYWRDRQVLQILHDRQLV